MRSQILPPALCLMMAILFSFSPSFSTAKSLSHKNERTDFKTVKLSSEMTELSNILAQKTQKKSDEIPIAEVKSAAVSKTTVSNTNTIIEENSYKSELNSVVGNEIISNSTNSELDGAPTLIGKGMFYGFTMMVILLNFICFFLFEEKIFLFYSLALTAITASFIYIDSFFPLIGINGIENVEAMQSTLLLLATASGALFASKYLTLEEFYPKLRWLTTSLLGFAFMMTFSGWISDTAFYTTVANITNFAVLGLYFSAGAALFSKKNYAKFYAIGFGIPLLFSLDFFVFQKLGINFLSTESFHLKAATVVEMLLITYAIIYRMRAIKEEHHLRQTEMRIFLKRQEVLNRSNTEKLMQDMYLENLIMQYDLDGFEIKLLQYISEGKDNAKIARKLKTTELDIELYTKELYNKLEIGDQIQSDYRMVETQPDYIYN